MSCRQQARTAQQMEWSDFQPVSVAVEGASIHARVGGSGAPLLLLHGFPETHLMWRHVAPRLASSHTIVCADLKGYGRSGSPRSGPGMELYSKRAMALDMQRVMAELGFARFSVAGHDRGGRVAYRLALDFPQCVERLAVLDIVPTIEVWERLDSRFVGYWPWIALAQPEPLAEQLLTGAAEAVVDNALSAWGSDASAFGPQDREAYVGALQNPETIHAICEEYRAAAATDADHDRDDRQAKRKIAAPTLALWAKDGAVDTWYEGEGGPLGIWARWCHSVTGQAIPGGHFFPEANADETAAALGRFFD